MNKFYTFLLLCFCIGNVNGQTTISTNFTNSNGQAVITFNVANTNSTAMVLTELASTFFTASATNSSVTLWYKTDSISSNPAPISAANGWIALATTSVPTTTSVATFFSGLKLCLPGNTTYGFALSSAGSILGYQTIAAGSYTFSGAGVNLNTGTNRGFGGILTSLPNTPRGFVGSITVATPASAGLPVNDVGVTNLLTPNTIECLTATQNFKVRIQNFGSATQTSIPVDVTVSGANTGNLSNTFTGSLPVCSYVDYTFPGTINMNSAGLNTINAYTSLGTDGNASNDNYNTTRTKTAGTPLPYSQNFNTFVAPAGFVGNFLYNGAPQHGTGASGGMFFNLWSNATSCNVTTPKFAAGNTGTEITFDYRLVNWTAYANPGGTATALGAGDSINLLVSNNCGVSFTRIYSINNSNHTTSNAFTNVSIPLGAYNGQELIFKFEGKWASGDYYIDIDNINITLPAPDDAGVQSLLSPTPASGCPSASTQVKVRIKNYGSNNITNVPVRVDIAGPIATVLNATYTGTIAPAATFDFVVGNADLSAAGTYTITAKTIYPSDPNNANDSFLPAVNVTTVLPQGFTYLQDFNIPGAPPGITGNMSYNTGFAPFHGTASSGGMFYNLWTNLPNRRFTATLPKLGNLNVVSEISFDYRIVNAAGYANPGGTATTLGTGDSINVMISTDCGASFVTLFAINNFTHLTANTFKNILLPLGSFAGKTAIIKFEGYWGAGNYFVDIDNINITIPLPDDAGVTAVVEPNITTGCPNSATPVKVRIKNFGISNLVNIPVQVNIVGASTAVINGICPGPILPGNSVDFIVGNADLSATGFHFFYAKTIYPGDPNSTNDSILTPTSIFNAVTYPIPYSENFDAFGAPAGYTGNMSYFAGGTGHGTGGSGGMYFNLNNFAGNSVVTLPKIGKFNNDAILSFDYRLVEQTPYNNPGGFQYTAKLTDSINIYASSDCGYTFNLIYSINGSNHNLSNMFRNIRIPLTTFAGKDVIFRFDGKWGGNGNFFIDMDNINIKNDTNDYLISSIITPLANTCYKTSEVKVTIKNNGTIGKANIPVVAQITGAINATLNYTFPNFLGIGQEDTIIIGTFNSNAGGIAQLSVFTNEKREDIRSNDTNTITFFTTSPVTILTDTNNYCQGGSTMLTASGSNTYKWYDGQTINPINITPTNSITVWAEGIDINNCIDTGYKNIVVYPNPIVGITNDTICLNEYGSIKATGGTMYNWGTFGTKSTVSHNPTTNTQYDVTVTNAFKCTATGTATIDVKPLPVYTIINDSQCMNNVATVSATGGVSYNWGVYGNSNSVVTNKLIKTLSFPVVITGANGCTVTDMATAYMRPGPDVTITNATICVGSGAQVSASGGVQYNWGVYGNAATANLGILTNSITIPVTVTDGLGCSVVKNATVTVNQKPKLTLNDEVICLGASAPLTADISTPGSTYAWSGGLNGSTVNVSPTTTTQYTVTATQPGPGGCSVTGSTTVFVKDKAPVRISPIDNSGVCSNINSIGLSATPVGGTFTGPNVNFSTFSPKKSGVGEYMIYYTFTDSKAKGCDGVDSVLVKVKACATGIYSLGENKEIAVYPNPFTTEVNLKFTGLEDLENIQVVVYDLTGKLVMQENAVLDAKNNNFKMNLEALTSGAYMVEVIQSSSKASFNIVKN